MSNREMHCVLGKFDIPIIQMQPPFTLDLLDTNLAIYGVSMSGKTTVIKTLIDILHKKYSEKDEQIFILDFGDALSEYRDYPLVAAYFDNSNEEYVKRVFKIMEGVLKENIKALNGKNYKDAEEVPIHTTFVIDNLNAFVDEPRYMAYQEKLAKLCRDGLSKGITIVYAAAETKGTMSYLGTCKQKIALELPTEKYVEVFNGKVGTIGNNPGHGFTNVTVKPEGVTGTFRMNMPYEVQCTVPYITEDEKKEFYFNLNKKFGYDGQEFQKHVKRYRTFPKELTEESYKNLIEQADVEYAPVDVVRGIGLDYVDFSPVSIDIKKNHVVAIYGKKEFGKTNTLNLMLNNIVKETPDIRIVLFDDGRKQLSEEMLTGIPAGTDVIRINEFREVELRLVDGATKTKKISPIQQFYKYLNDHYVVVDKRFMAGIYGLSRDMPKDFGRIPDCGNSTNPFTVFVIQNKSVYLNTAENKYFINYLLPQLVAVADENGYSFIFSDVQKISDMEQNQFFNNSISSTILLDNIAEFANERGQRTVFGNMDIKSLKEDYARCERGDGYYYDIEADSLQKMKVIKFGKE